MKKFRYFLLVVGTTLLWSSCDKWFDVSPKTQVKREDMFKDEAGFRDALYGIYTVMGRDAAYGGSQSVSTLDVIAQTYSSGQIGSYFTDLYEFKYSADYAENYINGMWSENYYAIANCNEILAYVDTKKDIFSEGIYELLKAEAIALRAYMHLEMLRAFGPVPSSANLDKPAIPIVKEVSPVAQPLSSINQAVDFVLEELEIARKLIMPYDPIGPNFESYEDETYYESSTIDMEHYNDNGFRLYRRSRMNYYGMTATMARAAIWAGRKTDALKYAKEVIESGKFALMTEEEYNNATDVAYWMSKNEHITSLYKQNIVTNIDEIYFNRNTYESLTKLYITETDIIKIFGNDRDFDWRYKKLIKQKDNSQYVNVKYASGHSIPLIKIGEMYYIAAEASNDFDFINQFRDHRGFENHQIIDDGVNEIITVLANEYQREFISEGQLFYFYKRHNFRKLHNDVEVNENVYVLPLPDDEIVFGNIVTE